MKKERTGNIVPVNTMSEVPKPLNPREAKRARRAANKAQTQTTSTRAFWIRRVAPVLGGTVSVAGAVGFGMYKSRTQEKEAAEYDAALRRRALTPSSSTPTPRNGEMRPVETATLNYGDASYRRNYVLVNLVEGLELELNLEHLDQLYRDPRVRIRVQDKEVNGVTPVNLIFIAPLGGVSNQQDILNHMLLVDPEIPDIKQEHQKQFPSNNAQYKSSSVPFHSTVRSAAISTTPSVGQSQRLSIRLSEDIIRASIQGTTGVSQNPLFSLTNDEERLVTEYQPLRVLRLDTSTIIKALNR